MADHSQALQWAYPGKGFQLCGDDATVDGKLTWLNWGNDPQPTVEEIQQKIAAYEAYIEATSSIDTGLGFRLRCKESDVLAFNNLSSLVKMKEDIGQPMESVSFYDSTGTKQTLPTAQFKQMIAAYGEAIYSSLVS